MYKTPEWFDDLKALYARKADKSFWEAIKFGLNTKKIDKNLEKMASGKKIKSFGKEDTLREYFNFLATCFIGYTNAWIGAREGKYEVLHERVYDIPTYEILNVINKARGKPLSLDEILYGEDLELQPIREIGSHLYLLSKGILKYSENIDLKDDAKSAMEFLEATQRYFKELDKDIFGFPIIKESTIEEYLKA